LKGQKELMDLVKVRVRVRIRVRVRVRGQKELMVLVNEKLEPQNPNPNPNPNWKENLESQNQMADFSHTGMMSPGLIES